MNTQNELEMFKDFLNDYNCSSTIISNIFNGIKRLIVRCNGCNVTKYSFQSFNLLIFSLKKVKVYKVRQFHNPNYNLNLYDAFLCEQEEEKLEGDNMIYCKNCKKLIPCTHKKEIYSMPQILIIVLDRGKNNKYFNGEFIFDEILDFSNINIILNQNSYKRFYLCGIIKLLGGNYIAYCRNNFNDNFICYNDASVSQVSVIDAMTTKISMNENERKTPYILFYHYIN